MTPEAKITPEMKAAGMNAFSEFDPDWDDPEECVIKIFRAMAAASARTETSPTPPKSISELAHERASIRAPLPAHDPTYAGLAGTVFCGLVLGVFTGLAGLPQDAHGIAFMITLVLGFVLPFAFYKSQERAHSKAWCKEYDELLKRDQAKT